MVLPYNAKCNWGHIGLRITRATTLFLVRSNLKLSNISSFIRVSNIRVHLAKFTSTYLLATVL